MNRRLTAKGLSPGHITSQRFIRLIFSFLSPFIYHLSFILLIIPTVMFAQSNTSTLQPVKILVHVTHGPESPTRAALGFHVAKAALEEGHQVTIFLAGDAVVLLRESTLDQLEGLGTGKLRELYDAIVARGGRFYLSGGSSKARGLSQQDLAGKPVQFATPRDLVKLAVEYDRLFNY
jgi:predicted peroxiredoxin